jgi:cyanophycinase
MASAARRRMGRLLVIGGAEDKNPDCMHILPRLVELGGGTKARLLVCAVASEEPEPTLVAYKRLFEKMGVADVHSASLRDRSQGERKQLLQALERATGVFLTGGDQLRITSVMAGTTFGDRLHERFAREGLFVAGTSAGAAAMSATMIVGGDGGTVRRSDVELAPGLGYWAESTLDTHFNREGRVHRLMTVFAQNPDVLGVGLDEDTAAEVTAGSRFVVHGTGVVMVFDGRVTHSNTARVGDHEPLALTDAKIHVLPAGYGFDLRSKRPIIPDHHARERAVARRAS